MPRALFEKTGNAIYISHLDLMRLFQRAFKRAGLPLTHSQGFNPRPSVSMALPLSLGIESKCELLDFELEGQKLPNHEILARLNEVLISGVRVLAVYDEMCKIKNLAYLGCTLMLEYDAGVPDGAQRSIEELFHREELLLEKKGKNGLVEQNIVPMIKKLTVVQSGSQEITLSARICCQNPALNPMQISAAIVQYLPALTPDHVRCRREEVYDTTESVFR